VVIEAQALHRKVALCASDFLRTWQTAEEVLEALKNAGIDVWLDSIRMEVALRERYFGSLEGASAGNYSQVYTQLIHFSLRRRVELCTNNPEILQVFH